MKSRNHLGALDLDGFMRRHWQREPLLIRGAIEGFEDPLAPEEVLQLAGSDEAVSRLVERRRGRWHLEHGPIPRARFRRLAPRDWTVLVQDTNHFSPRAAALLARFDFIPHARIDDVMVSYAVPGGGVGPHVDSYDVFLLQGRGRRRWQISRQADHAFVPGLPLRVLRRFVPEQEWVLEAGDMLYLPPGVAHHGVAESECLTWSVGFRAPTDAELARGFLDYLHDAVALDGQFGDAGAAPTRHPGEIPAAMLAHAHGAAGRIRWSAAMVREFTGRHLSEPKAHVYFSPPARALAPAAFRRAAARAGLALDPKTRLLYSGAMFFINGESAAVDAASRPALRRLADRRAMPSGAAAPEGFWRLAHAWYARGLLHLAEDAR
ncbi:MAG TPA: cupin domain-containing protein [Usitatibacter sp.]|nr:cupin domain-containing protein [Usitatibacter sp.]